MERRSRMKKPSMLVIFLTVFIDLVGFGIVVPLLPVYVEHFGAHGFVIGLIVASFSAMQFVFAPIWGRLSDRIGRRPVLLMSTAGAAVSYVLFALSSGLANHTAALWMMLVSRSLAGVCGGNITVAQAYMADISTPEQRSRSMGLIGMAFGLGFILGPLIGLVSLKSLGITGPGWVAAGFCAANFVLASFILVESLQPSSEHVARRPHLHQWLHTLRQPQIGLLICVFFLATFCFSAFESTLALVVMANFQLDTKAALSTAGYLFVFCGLIAALVQGGAIGQLVKRLGEAKLIALSLVLTALCLCVLPFIKGSGPLSWHVLLRPEGVPWIWMLGALALLSVGTSLTRPPLFGLLSLLTPRHEQGETLGVAQSAGSLARIPGPVFAASLLSYTPALPYLICGAIALLAGLYTWRALAKHQRARVSAEKAQTA